MQVQKTRHGYKLVKSLFGKYEEIPEEWDLKRLDDIGQIIGGGTPDSTITEYWNGEILWAVPTDITKLSSNFISDTERKITKKGLTESSAKLLPIGAILITTRATIGECAINTKPIATNQGFQNLVCNDAYDTQFMFYTIKFHKNKLLRLSYGTTFLEISKSEIKKVLVALPKSIREQQKIAFILSNIDSLINQTQKIIDQTQKLKKGLMQKLLTRGIGHTKFKKVKWLFGQEIEIPQSWNLTILKEISTDGLQNGIFKKAEDFGFGVPLVNVSDLFSENEIRLQNLGKVNVSQKELAQFGIQEGDLFFCRSSLALDGIGRSNMIMKAETPAVFECHVMMLRPNNLVRPKYLFYFTRSHMFRQYIFSIAMTLTMTTIRQPDLEKAPILLPPIDEQQKILLILSDLDTTLEQLEKKVTQLELLKKGLMQKLLTGQIRVKV